ncbi:MAG: hypothetical protein Q9219_001511 [cf. Caloplaca sp. 3 TL-2023]
MSYPYLSKFLWVRISQKPSPFLTPAFSLYSTKAASSAVLHDSKRSTTVSSIGLNPAPVKSEDVNPPASTLPPLLTLPTRQPNLSGTQKLTFFYRTGKAYLSFYKSGIKAIYQNYKLLRQLRPRIPRGQPLEQALRDGSLTRAEYHLVRRTRRDVSRIPLFGLVLAICGEFTPLVVVFMGLNSAVPKTCHIPRQVDGARKKLEDRRRESFRAGTVTNNEIGNVKDIPNLPKPILAHIGRSLGLYSSLWDKIGLAPTVFLPRRIRKAVDRIDVDDLAIARDGGVGQLSEEEVKLAAEERGIDIIGKPIGETRSVLTRWIDVKKRTSTIDLLSKRPSAWPR